MVEDSFAQARLVSNVSERAPREHLATMPARTVENTEYRILTREELTEEVREGGEKDYVFFWGPQEAEEGVISEACFSQWYPSRFVVDGDTYETAEHYMMAEKARLFRDEEIRQQILRTEAPRAVKALGQRVRGFKQDVWFQNRERIVINGNLAKFRQNEEMLEYMLGTGAAVLVEASPMDKIWGIGLRASSEDAREPQKWRGTNLLGFCLMRVREMLSN